MRQRTAEIIAICKGRHEFGENLSPTEAIATYMSDDTGCPTELYDDVILESIVADALFDFIDGMTMPSSFLRDIRDIYCRHNTFAEMKGLEKISYTDAVCFAFSTVSVKRDGKFINGFTKENTRLTIKLRNKKDLAEGHK